MCVKKILLFVIMQGMSILSQAAQASSVTLTTSHKESKVNLLDFKYDQKDLKDILNVFAEKEALIFFILKPIL